MTKAANAGLKTADGAHCVKLKDQKIFDRSYCAGQGMFSALRSAEARKGQCRSANKAQPSITISAWSLANTGRPLNSLSASRYQLLDCHTVAQQSLVMAAPAH